MKLSEWVWRLRLGALIGAGSSLILGLILSRGLPTIDRVMIVVLMTGVGAFVGILIPLAGDELIERD